MEGQWLCDCNPRLPALYLQVKKESANKGKWFYTCQGRKCKFFLWADEAKARERGAVLNNSRSESSQSNITTHIRSRDEGAPPEPPSSPTPQRRPSIFQGLPRNDADLFDLSDTDEEMELASLADKTPEQLQVRAAGTPFSQSQQQASGASSHTIGRSQQASMTAPATPTPKRKRGLFVDSDEEDEFGEAFDSDTERQLAQLTDESARKSAAERASSAQKSAHLTTPSAGRAVDVYAAGGLPTPVSRHTGPPGRNSLLIAQEERDRDAKRHKKVEFAPTPENLRSPESSPAAADSALPVRTPTNAQIELEKLAGSAAEYDITEPVMALLKDQPINQATRRGVKEALEKNALKIRGLIKGRDVARSALESRDTRIAELSARVAALENGRRLDRERLKELTRGLTQLSQEDD